MKIYISGSISKNPNYKEQFAAAEKDLRELGYEVLNPAKNTGNLYKEYIDKGLLQEMKCDAIYMLQNFEESTGAMLELAYAQAVGMQIIYQQEDPTMKKAEATINISIEEYSRLKDIETRFKVLRDEMLHLEYCPLHTQIVLGIEAEYKKKHSEHNEIEIPPFMAE